MRRLGGKGNFRGRSSSRSAEEVVCGLVRFRQMGFQNGDFGFESPVDFHKAFDFQILFSRFGGYCFKSVATTSVVAAGVVGADVVFATMAHKMSEQEARKAGQEDGSATGPERINQNFLATQRPHAEN